MTQDYVQFYGDFIGGFWEGHTRIFHRQAGEPLLQDSLPKILEEGRQERIPERVLHWTKRVSNVWGDSLHE